MYIHVYIYVFIRVHTHIYIHMCTYTHRYVVSYSFIHVLPQKLESWKKQEISPWHDLPLETEADGRAQGRCVKQLLFLGEGPRRRDSSNVGAQKAT